MKKFTMLAVLTAFLALGVDAQISFKPHFGFNWSQLSSEPQDFRHEGRAGVQIGVGLRIGDRLYVEPAVQWALLNADLTNTVGPSTTVESSVNLFRVPVMFGYDFMEKDNFLNIRAFTGPAANFVLSTDGPNALTKDDYASTIFGWDLGVGVDVWFVYMELSYEFGITSVFSDTDAFGDAKNNAFLLTLGANLF